MTVIMPDELTAENGAKIALIGEFKEFMEISCVECGGSGCAHCDDSGVEVLTVPVSWTTIKAIYKKAVDLLGDKQCQ